MEKNSTTKEQVLNYYKSRITEDKIILISLKKVQLIHGYTLPIIGIKKVYETNLNFVEPHKFNSELFDKIRQPDLFDVKLQILREQSLLFQKINSIKDLKKGSNLKTNIRISIASSLSGACRFIPFPFTDVPPVIGIEVGMVFTIAALYGFKPQILIFLQFLNQMEKI